MSSDTERRYRAVDRENRLVARGLEKDWEQRLRDLATAEAKLERCQRHRPPSLAEKQRRSVLALGNDLQRVWSAPTTTHRDRKELLRTFVEDVIIAIEKAERRADLTIRWRGGALTALTVALPNANPRPVRTSEDTVELVCRLAAHYPDALVAGILNRQGRTTAHGAPFTASHVRGLRRHRGIPCFQPPAESPKGDLVKIAKAAEIPGVASATVRRWLDDGFIAGEQITAGAPWSVRLTDDVRARIVEQAPEGYVPMAEAMRRLGVSRQTVIQRVKRGQLDALYVQQGKRKGMRIKLLDALPDLFPDAAANGG